MANLDRTLTNALIGNFTELESWRRERKSAPEEQQLIMSAVLRLKGQELRLQAQIRTREHAGGPLKTSLARADRGRLKIVLRIMKELQEVLRSLQP
jgi:hypothetical protein